MTKRLETINKGVCICLLIVFIFLLYLNYIQDLDDEKMLDGIVCHKEVDIPSIKMNDKLIVESIIEEYNKKKTMNTSNCARVIGDVKLGISKGIISGVIVSGGIGGAAVGAIVYGSISGISTAYNLIYHKQKYLKYNKHS